jgi:RND family efflux transporter MFP subunit
VVSLLGDAGGKPIAEGQLVAKGAVIAQLDATVVEANLAKAEAAQEVLREEEQQAKYAVELAANEVDRLAKLKAEEDRRPVGNRTQLVSPVDRLKADYAVKDAQSKRKGAAGKLSAGMKEIESLRAQLKLHTLTAPIAGHVGRIQVVRGQTLAVGALVAEITDLDQQIDVLCFVPPSMIARLKREQPARIGGFDSNGEAESAGEGRVGFIAEQAEPETGNFAVKVRFPNQKANLKSNRVIRIRVRTQPGRDCFSLPETAVLEDEQQPTVVVV